MSRPKLTPLSDLLPQKGEATRPELVSDPLSKEASEQARNQASERADAHGTKPGSWNSSEQDSNRTFVRASEQENMQVNEQASLGQGLPTTVQGSRPRSKRASLHDPSEYRDGPRSAVSFRMTEHLQDRLREYAHQSRRKKQDILDEAVHEFLMDKGY
jgi:hypothetical protein